MPASLLSRVRIVLVEPQYGGNVGQCARAMINTGLSRLVLVEPREHRTDEAFWMARDGRRILESALVTTGPGALDEALRPVGLALATTRRIGRHRRADFTPRQAAARILPLLASGNDVALVFGREDNGLASEEIDRCQGVVTIPSSAEFPSFNLAQAVLICGYELFLAALEAPEGAPEAVGAEPPPPLAGPEKLERFYEQLGQVLTDIGFLVGDQAPAVFRALRRVFGRAGLDPRELKMLHGVLAQMEWYRRRSERDRGEAVIRWASARDFPGICRLLDSSGLPSMGLHAPGARQDGLEQRLFVLWDQEELAGCVGLECAPDAVLLRSLAVAREFRGKGFGVRLVAEAVGEAGRLGAKEVYLLTRDAVEYFARFGFERIPREQVPEPLRASATWEHACCASATAMRRKV